MRINTVLPNYSFVAFVTLFLKLLEISIFIEPFIQLFHEIYLYFWESYLLRLKGLKHIMIESKANYIDQIEEALVDKLTQL